MVFFEHLPGGAIGRGALRSEEIGGVELLSEVRVGDYALEKLVAFRTLAGCLGAVTREAHAGEVPWVGCKCWVRSLGGGRGLVGEGLTP